MRHSLMIPGIFPLILGGCSILAALDEPGGQLPACQAGDESTQRDLVVVLDHLAPHIGDRAEIRVVSEGNFITARAILDPVASESMTVRMRQALTPGPRHLDLFVDLNQNGVYDPPPADHAWRLPACASGVFRFSHNANFLDIEAPAPQGIGNDFTMHVRSFSMHLGDLVEVYVVNQSMSVPTTVGLYRLAEAEAADFDIRIPGIIEPGVSYTIGIWADKNDDGEYQAPDIDHSWRVEATGEASGLEIDFTHNTNFADVSELR
jgi:hypothetical protein